MPMIKIAAGMKRKLDQKTKEDCSLVKKTGCVSAFSPGWRSGLPVQPANERIAEQQTVAGLARDLLTAHGYPSFQGPIRDKTRVADHDKTQWVTA